jgi:electron transfer flavoprotein beta subunit
MGPESVATAGVRKALSMGAHRSVLISDDTLKGADVAVTARVLAEAIKKQEPDLVIAGVESTDGSSGVLPQAVAEHLGLPAATFTRKLEIKDGMLHVERQTEVGYDVLEVHIPAVVTLTAGANQPRYPTLKGIMQAKQKPLEQLAGSDLGLDGDAVKSTQEVTAVNPAPEKSAGEIVEDDGEGFKKIADFLAKAKVI